MGTSLMHPLGQSNCSYPAFVTHASRIGGEPNRVRDRSLASVLKSRISSTAQASMRSELYRCRQRFLVWSSNDTNCAPWSAISIVKLGN